MQFINSKWVNGKDPLHRIVVDPQSQGTFTIAPVAAVAASANGATIVANEGTNQSTEQFAVLVTVVVTAAPAGTSPTLVVNLQDASTSGGSYTTRGSSATINAAGSYTFFAVVSDLFYRVSFTVGGTGGPSFNTAVYATPFKFGVAV